MRQFGGAPERKALRAVMAHSPDHHVRKVHLQHVRQLVGGSGVRYTCFTLAIERRREREREMDESIK